MGPSLPSEVENTLIKYIRAKTNPFAISLLVIPSIDPTITDLHLNIDPNAWSPHCG